MSCNSCNSSITFHPTNRKNKLILHDFCLWPSPIMVMQYFVWSKSPILFRSYTKEKIAEIYFQFQTLMLIFSCLVKQYIYRFKGTGQSKIKSVSQHLSATLLNCSPSSTTSLTSLDCLGPSTPTTTTVKVVNSQAQCRWIISVRKSSAFFSSSKPQNAVNDGLEICTYVKT